MSTLKVDKIEPFSGGQVEITGLNVTGFASTGSNAFDGDQTITGSLTISSSTEFDVAVTGRVKIQGPSTGQTPQLVVSGSDAFSNYGRFSINQKRGGWTTDIGNGGDSGIYYNFYKDDFTEDVAFISKTNAFANNGTDAPGFVFFTGVDYDATIQFKSGTNWGDGTIKFNVPIQTNGNIVATGSVQAQNGDLLCSNNVRVDNTTHSWFRNNTTNAFGSINGFNVFGSGDGIGTTTIINSGSTDNLGTAQAYISQFVNGNTNGAADIVVLNRKNDNGLARINIQNDNGTGAAFINISGTSTGAKSLGVIGGSSSSAIIGVNAGAGKIARIEAYDSDTFNSTISFKSNPAGGGLLEDYSPITEDYSTVLEVGNYGDWNNGLIKFYRNADVSGSWDFSGSVEVKQTVSIGQALTLAPQDPLPSADTGSLAVSGSNLYYYDGTSWSQLN